MAAAQMGGAGGSYDGNGGDQPSTGGYGGSSGSGGFDYSSLPIFQKMNKVLIAHATLATLAWAFFFPLGGILLRTIHSKSTWKIHASVQILAFIMFTAAVGMGIWLAKQYQGYIHLWNDPHIIIGLLIFALAALQPAMGFVHHLLFIRRANGKRTNVGRIHLWLGRILIVLGIINGGLGLRLAGSSPFQSQTTTRKAEIGYSIGAGIMFLLYALVSITAEAKRDAGRRGLWRGKSCRSSSTDDVLYEEESRVRHTPVGSMVESR